MIKSDEISIGGYFNYISDSIDAQESSFIKPSYKAEPPLQQQKNNKANFKSIYLANSGIYNTFSTLIKLVKGNKLEVIEYVLRAVYVHEAYLVVEKMLKDVENPADSAKEKLIKLLGIDYEKHSTSLPDIFEIFDESQGKIKFNQKYFIDLEMLNEFIKNSFYIEYICLLPDYLAAVYSEDPIGKLKRIPEMCEKFLMHKLNIDRNKKIVNLFAADNE